MELFVRGWEEIVSMKKKDIISVSIGCMLCFCALCIALTQYIAEWWLLPFITGQYGVTLILFGLKGGEKWH